MMIDSSTDTIEERPAEQRTPSRRGATLLSLAGMVAAIASLSCCVVPFVLFLTGIGGAWIANLTALAPYRPMFLTMALGLLGTGFYFVYRWPKAACVEGSYCASSTSSRVVRSLLWVSSGLVALSVAFPYVVPLFYGE